MTLQETGRILREGEERKTFKMKEQCGRHCPTEFSAIMGMFSNGLRVREDFAQLQANGSVLSMSKVGEATLGCSVGRCREGLFDLTVFLTYKDF